MNPSTSSPGAEPFRLDYGYATDRGLRRELNEDAFLADRFLFAVADGMGGHEAGEVASSICVRTLAEGQDRTDGPLTAEGLQALMQQADRAIREAAGSRAGTTLSGAAVVYEGGAPYWLVFNVGDSRTYLMTRGRLAQVSVDHSEVQELVDGGHISAEEALVHPRRHVITRALGTGDDSEADFWMLPVREGDRLLICSDGLTGEVGDEDIAEVVGRQAAPQDAVGELVQAALRAGGRDNITVIVVDVVHEHDDDALSDTAPRPVHEDSQTKPRREGEGA
ncbi:PP2C family protein-serine/threonine phosphatase [Zafaria sp. Z1313]|uniref:PP2C family protein-serine/threonine phosphatase n=1 Tax=unclassified Zafaria TaxID=2828765 RepID=UPI002E765850|nr:protein phosphatase 2C domain-containing protein [Zafaria sp. J156]MEE1620003.1 protein phosphatase 2C domain-containing protein [Zafaria sp. J156]